MTPRSWFAGLLSFNAGFVDAAGFLGLHGLFIAHVTGNFVTLGAALAFGTHDALSKLAALPEFVVIVAAARLAGAVMTAHAWPTVRLLLAAQVGCLLAFFLLAVRFGPFSADDTPELMLTGFAGIAAMAIQNAVQRVHFGTLPPTTMMTGTTTQATMDAVDLLHGLDPSERQVVLTRLRRSLAAIACFATGCAGAAILIVWIGLWCLALPVAVGLATAWAHHHDRP